MATATPDPGGLSQVARDVHAAAFIVDLHADTPKLLRYGYDLYRRHRTPWPLSTLFGHVDLPRLREGNVAAQLFTLWTFPVPEAGCNRDSHRQLDALEDAVARGGDFALCRNADDLRAARAAGRIGVLRGIEGGQALEGHPSPDEPEGPEGGADPVVQLRRFATRGLRTLGLLHFSRNALGFPAMGFRADPSRGLTTAGAAVVDACRELGVLVDLAHINRRGFFDVVARRPGPLLVSHTGLAGVTPHWRNIDDDQLRAVAHGGGIIGIIFAPRFLGQKGLDGVVAHLRHALRIVGEDAVALGSDWDGFVEGAGPLRDPAGLPHLTEALLRSGVPDRVVHKILGENALRLFAA